MAAACEQVLVLGGGAGGLITSLVLAQRGCEVTVLERNPERPPDSDDAAWSSWDRRGVTQFRQPHGISTRALQVIDDVAPRTASELREVAVFHRPASEAPDPDAVTKADRGLRVALVRRPTLERMLAAEVDAADGIEVRRAAAATGLLSDIDASGRVVVRGLCTADGEEIRADLVVDCAGRRSPVASWLAEAGVEVEASAESDGFSYSSQWFRRSTPFPSTDSGVAAAIGPGLIALLFPADGGTFAIAMVGSVKDPVFRRVQQAEPFMRLARRLPALAEWLTPDDDVEAITDTVPMGSIQNRHLRLRTSSARGPIGIVNSSDSFASTNPSLGRGIGIAADMAVRLGDLVAGCDRGSVADEWDAVQQEFHRPWLDDAIASDANTRAVVHRLRTGESVEPPHPWRRDLIGASMVDMDCWRAFTEVNQILRPPTRWTRDAELLERARGIVADLPPMPPPPLTRSELETIVA